MTSNAFAYIIEMEGEKSTFAWLIVSPKAIGQVGNCWNHGRPAGAILLRAQASTSKGSRRRLGL